MSLHETISTILTRDASERFILNSDLLRQDSQIKPINRKTVTYIVGVVLLNEKDQVCLIQESKPSCHGKWYLPAGRVENNEDLLRAVKRECLEETGYEIEPINLCMVEIGNQGSWFRFTFTGLIRGGFLKKPEKADKESLQAQWFDLASFADKCFLSTLRSSDFIQNIEVACKYYCRLKFRSTFFPHQINLDLIKSNSILPLSIPNETIRFTFLFLNINSNVYLVHESEGKLSLPSVLNTTNSLRMSLRENFFDSLVEKSLIPNCFKNLKNTSVEIENVLSVC